MDKLDNKNVIFTTSFFNLGKWKCKSPENYLNWFEMICQTGIYIVVYTSGCYYDAVKSIADRYANVLLVMQLELDDLQVAKWIVQRGSDIKLPETRNTAKDTIPFLACMNSKIELLAQTMEYGINGVIPRASNYVWLDFGIFHILKDPNTSSRKLQQIAENTYANGFIAFPGCWRTDWICDIDNAISWRFCGGFFIISSSILKKYHIAIMKYLENYILEQGRITWEVNIWASVERENNHLPFGWYLADHNDTILNIPILLNKVGSC